MTHCPIATTTTASQRYAAVVAQPESFLSLRRSHLPQKKKMAGGCEEAPTALYWKRSVDSKGALCRCLRRHVCHFRLPLSLFPLRPRRWESPTRACPASTSWRPQMCVQRFEIFRAARKPGSGRRSVPGSGSRARDLNAKPQFSISKPWLS